MRLRLLVLGWLCMLASSVSAQPEVPAASSSEDTLNTASEAPEAPPVEATPAPSLPPPAADTMVLPPASEAPDVLVGSSILSKIRIHGFVSEGAFKSTANDYIGESSRGSLKMLETGLNVAVEPVDGLRVALQLVARAVGTLSENVPRLDWAVIDYRLQRWLGMRAGLIKMPLGLYNEFADIDSARNAILLPQSLYPVRNRDPLIALMGFGLYGNLSLGAAGELEYNAWFGTLNVPRSSLELSSNTRLDSVDTRYVTGARLFWLTPLEGLRLGVTYLRAVIDFYISLDAATTNQVIMAQLAPADYDGKLKVSQNPTSFWVASGEYIRGDWLFAAEYSRWLKYQVTSITALVPTLDEDAERFYGMINYRLSPHFEVGTYYAVTHLDVNDRAGRNKQHYKKRFYAYQRDLAATLRVDINEYWLWKLEGHFIDGTAELQTTVNPDPKRYWGLFLLKTTVTF
ncbi:MAG TPA: hypothetical protein VFN67_10805 [Polyangiales bacterium]|nr:hypothetical protein [Polyangiales bacterium]